jgi:hypothetical protein
MNSYKVKTSASERVAYLIAGIIFLLSACIALWKLIGSR